MAGRVTSNGVTVEVTRIALLMRMLALLLVAIDLPLTPLAALGQVIVGVITLWLLRSARARAWIARHPLAVMADVLLLAVVATLSGAKSPFLLVLMISALLVGLWTDAWAGAIVLAALLVLYGLLWQREWNGSPLDSLLVPVFFLVLWWLGYAVQQSGLAERRARQALSQAISAAATTEERARLARDLHDTLAKSLQAMHLTAAALPVLIDRDPAAAKRTAGDLQAMSNQAIGEARAFMAHLRRVPRGDDLAELVLQLCEEWELTTAVPVRTDLDADIEVTDDMVRYQVLATVSEALENIRRHAQAHAVEVRVRGGDTDITVEIADDGVGIEDGRLAEAYAAGHYGFRGMTERMGAVGGSLVLQSTPGAGTRIVLTAPRHGLVEVGEVDHGRGEGAAR